MNADIALVYIVLVVVLAGFLWSRRPAEVIAMTGAGGLLVAGVVPVEEMLDVFGNPGPVTVGALFVLTGALQRTGVVDHLRTGAESLAELSPARARLTILAAVMAISAIINNTPVVMVMVPLVVSLAQRLHTLPSKLLLPLSYASVLGGACTIIGTSTNLIVDGVAREQGLEPFGIFEITLPGLIIGAVGMAYLMLLGPWLVPERRPLMSTDDVKPRRDFVTELYVDEGSDLDGCRLADTDVFSRDDVVLVEVLRDGHSRRANGDLELRAGDRLVIQSNATSVLELRELVHPTSSGDTADAPKREALLAGFHPLSHRRSTIMEGIIGPDSRLVGQIVGNLNLRRAYDVSVLALHRQGRDLREFENEELRFGDTLLLESSERNLRAMFAQQDLVNLSEPAAKSYRRGHAPIALLSLLAIVVLAALDVMPIVALALVGAVVVLALGCIEPQEAYRSIDWRILFLIFGMLGIGRAMESTGAAALIVDQLATLSTALGPWWMLAAVYAVASLLTEMLTNNAVAVLLTPLVIGLAEQMGVDPRPFVVAVMFAASASFATPLGYQTNTIVYGAGNYRFTDFLRVGAPLNVLVGVIAVVLIPLFWPLNA